MSDIVIPSRVILDAPIFADRVLAYERARIMMEMADHRVLAFLYGEGIAQAVFGIGLLMRGRWPL